MTVGLHTFWALVLEPLARALRAREIVLAGGRDVELVRDLLTFGATVCVLAPQHGLDLDALRSEFGDRFASAPGPSLGALPEDRELDLLLLEGDPNWFATRRALRLAEERALAHDRRPPTIVVHGVDGPQARRDQYLDPDAIPAAYRQPYARRGVVPGQAELAGDGLDAHLCNALVPGGERNGVRTAVEDFVRESDVAWKQYDLHGAHGVSVLVTAEAVADNAALSDVLDGLSDAETLRAWLERLEELRVGAELEAARLRAELERASASAAPVTATPARAERLSLELELARDAQQRLQERFELLAGELAQVRVERDRFEELARRSR
ncbi:BAR domain-containing protein [Capillimicrobium parvum]|uniref:Uncharacterized protein n=1 Tax=Capillimicrobium parvum TaxID=2884022 RepID=A0A9E6XSK8_9ACTN|nr:hypothetical protein [Capillimicrobium parvum]UGS33950.1 hypothetical protein DSM104329_00317 [Capillimicrobium parvum]